MPNFETFTRRMVPLAKQPSVTIQKRGTMSLNAAAYAALGEPEAVELLYDRDERIVGFRAAPRGAEHAYPLRAQTGTYIVSGTAFTKYYRIDTTISRRWVGYLDEDVLCVDLGQPGTEVTSNRNGNRASADDDESV
ncbi:hypothetical protein [Streptosporangium saharense]|uniref:hypothetical protein n=1 Tax=Streptosporangium saharense TaxID=1706840 RepID=UPI0036A883C9